MHLAVSYQAPIARRYPDDYIREVTMDLLDYGETEIEDFVLGRIRFREILCAEIELDDEDPRAICDSFSSTLSRIWRRFMTWRIDTRPELSDDYITRSLVVVERILLHPDIASAAIHICAAAIELFDLYALVVARRDVLPLTDRELADLAFCKAAGTKMIFRHGHQHRNYDEAYPRGKEVLFEASPEHEAWVEEEWAKREA